APAAAGAASKVSLEANPEGKLEYNTKALSATAGKVTVDFTNSSSLPHNVTIESSSGAKVGATPTFSGGSKSVAVNLKPGTYKFFCSVPGHRQAGMEGTLTVKERPSAAPGHGHRAPPHGRVSTASPGGGR